MPGDDGDGDAPALPALSALRSVSAVAVVGFASGAIFFVGNGGFVVSDAFARAAILFVGSGPGMGRRSAVDEIRTVPTSKSSGSAGLLTGAASDGFSSFSDSATDG